MRLTPLRLALMLVMVALASSLAGAAVRVRRADSVTFWRLPAGCIQPQAQADGTGTIHLIYFKKGSSEGAGNLYYVRLTGPELTSSAPIRVNDQPDTAGSIGTVRTANLALGRDNRIHVAWNGLGPKQSNGYPAAYQAYARLNSAGTAFEPQRDLATWAKGLDGGGSVAADREGNVYVVWHATAGAKDETGRAVYVAHSSDDGATFARERRANPEATGACGCCGLHATVDAAGRLVVLYRAAGGGVNRDTMLLVSSDRGQSFKETLVQRWSINACPMSTYALAPVKGSVLAAWETKERIFFGTIDPAGATISAPVEVAGERQKHPSIVSSGEGRTLVAWAEGTGWQRGGALAWEIVGPTGSVVDSGRKAGAIPVWGLPAACARADGSVVVIY